MRIDRISLKDFPPIKNIDIQTSSNLVIIAGANGSGKTRLKEAIVYSFVKPNEPQVSLSLKTTRTEEEIDWRANSLQVVAGNDCPELRKYLSTRTGNNSFLGTLVQVESNRKIGTVQFQSITSTTPDPDEQGLDHSWHLDTIANRWNKLVNNIFAKSAIRNEKIARFTKENPDKTGADAHEAIPDPFLPYQKLFNSLLPDKMLEPIDTRFLRDFEYRTASSQPLSFGSLSSGEREVVTMVFDLAYKKIAHSIILIDEPELHLHPSLTFRFVETLKGLGGGTNQIILFTHSADLISTYYSTGNVFVLNSESTETNQALKLSTLDENHSTVARVISSSLGMFATGKKLVFVEGRNDSADRLIFNNIVQNSFPHFQIVPIGSVGNITMLRSVVDELTNTIFGIDLFFIRDRDGLSDKIVSSLETNSHFRCLPRRHIENYLLDPEILSAVANNLNIDPKKAESSKIEGLLFEIASQNLMRGVLWNIREYIRIEGILSQPEINKSEIDQIPYEQLAENIAKQLEKSLNDASKKFNTKTIQELILEEHKKLKDSLSSNNWGKLLPGKPIFNRFCSDFFHKKPEIIRELYMNLAFSIKPEVFQDISEIFQSFSTLES